MEVLLLINISARRGIVVCKINGSVSMSNLGFPCFIYFEVFIYDMEVVFKVTCSYFNVLKLHLGKVRSFRDSVCLPK